MKNLSELLKEKLGIDCEITEDGDRLLVQYFDGCPSSKVVAIANQLGLSVTVDRGFSEDKFTDFAVDFGLELGVEIADIRFKKDDGVYRVIIPDNEIGERLKSII